MTLERMILLGGLLHLSLLIAAAQVPKILDFRGQLARVDVHLRRLIWVHGAFIVLTLAGFGVLSLAQAVALAGGSALARAFCGFVAVFWIARLGVQAFIFDESGLARTPLLKLGYHALTAVFVYLAAVYGWAALA